LVRIKRLSIQSSVHFRAESGVKIIAWGTIANGWWLVLKQAMLLAFN
jgi:hypothetical protein